MLVVIKRELMEKIDHEITLAKSVAKGNGILKKYAEGMAAGLRNIKNDIETMNTYDVYINNANGGNEKK